MAILWCGGEDLDFPGSGAPSVNITAGRFRSGYARCALGSPATLTYVRSNAFPGGAVTSCWLSSRITRSTGSNPSIVLLLLGLTSSATPSTGLWVGLAASSFKLGLYTFDGTTKTLLAAESGVSLSGDGVMYRIDVQLVNYGATATVNVYLDGVQVITFSGDVTVGGLTNVDSVGFNGVQVGTILYLLSEFMVADEDLRAFPGLVTLALTGAGTTDQWTGAFSTINQTTLSDASPNFTNTTAQDQQFNWTDLPSGAFDIKAVKISARMAKSASPAVTQVKMGYNSGGSVAFGTGATKAPTTAYATYEQLDAINPVTTAAFVQSEMNALQVDLQSLT